MDRSSACHARAACDRQARRWPTADWLLNNVVAQRGVQCVPGVSTRSSRKGVRPWPRLGGSRDWRQHRVDADHLGTARPGRHLCRRAWRAGRRRQDQVGRQGHRHMPYFSMYDLGYGEMTIRDLWGRSGFGLGGRRPAVRQYRPIEKDITLALRPSAATSFRSAYATRQLHLHGSGELDRRGQGMLGAVHATGLFPVGMKIRLQVKRIQRAESRGATCADRRAVRGRERLSYRGLRLSAAAARRMLSISAKNEQWLTRADCEW